MVDLFSGGGGFSFGYAKISRDISTDAVGLIVKRKQKKAKGRAVKYTVGEIGRLRVVSDFPPSPDAMVPRKSNSPHPEERPKAASRRMRRPHGSRRVASQRSSP
jgi:hypothetical protein